MISQRISKEMQTRRALTMCDRRVLHTVLFARVLYSGGDALLGTVDCVSCGFVLWMVGYVFLTAFHASGCAKFSKARAGARAMVTGQVWSRIDHQYFQDRETVRPWPTEDSAAALGARCANLAGHEPRFVGGLGVSFRFWLMAIAGFCRCFAGGRRANGIGPLGLGRGALSLQTGAVVRAAGAKMTGWVSFTLMALYANMGEVRGRMRHPRGPSSA